MNKRVLKGLAAIATLAFLVGGFFISSYIAGKNSVAMGATIPTPVALFETSLAQSISATDTAMTLVSATDKDGTVFAGETYGFIIDEGTALEEFVIATCTGTSCTSMVRGVSVRTGNTSITSLKKSHRRGASVKITDGPVLLTLARILNGTDSLPNPISGVTPISGSDLTTKAYVDSVVNGGTISYDQTIIEGTAGETVAAGETLYFNVSTGRWNLTDADTASTINNVLLGIAQGAGTNGNTITGGVLLFGIDSNQSGLTPGVAYYLSNTAGDISSTPGTKTVAIGVAKSSTELILAPRFSQQLTGDLVDALTGSQGVPSSANKFITQDNLSTSLTDQTQATQNSSSTIGEADTTGLRNDLAQSFIPTFTKIRGVNLYKSADTGTFTGTVTITLQADTAGSPSGSALATKTYTNSEWIALSTGEIESIFASEYASMTVGSLYWIVIETSTSDTSNHPNIGINTAGGYASGSAKYKNATDGWVAISTIDLYFKTIQGTASQVILTNTSGKIESAFYDITEMPVPAFQQDFSLSTLEAMATNGNIAFGSNASGSVLYAFVGSTTSAQLYRFERDAYTGQYMETHVVNPTLSATASDTGSIIEIGTYIYVFTNDSTNVIATRFNRADLTGEQAMTVPTLSHITDVLAWTDGTFAYVVLDGSATTSRKWSISGTTMTAVSTATVASLSNTEPASMFDGLNAYVGVVKPGTTGLVINKLTNVNGSTKTTTTKALGIAQSSVQIGSIFLNIDTSRMYVGFIYQNWNKSGAASEQSTNIRLIPIAKP